MAKKATTPKMYEGLDFSNNKEKHLCLVKTKNNELFKFSSVQSNSIIADACEKVWSDWNSFDNEPEQQDPVKLAELHKNLYTCEPLKGATRIDVSIACWHKMIATAQDRTGKLGTDPAKAKVEGKRANRMYFAVKVQDPKNPEQQIWFEGHGVSTRQASVCLKILRETQTLEKDAVSEADLKAAIAARQAEIMTRQDPWRIFQYYRPLLVSKGAIKHD